MRRFDINNLLFSAGYSWSSGAAAIFILTLLLLLITDVLLLIAAAPNEAQLSTRLLQRMKSARRAQEKQQDQELQAVGGDDSACLKGLLDALSPGGAAAGGAGQHDQYSGTSDPLSTWTPTALASPCAAANSSVMAGITCDRNTSRVTSIWLPSANLVGTLPSSLALCSSLTTLNLSGNFVGGSIPMSLGALSYLSTLSLSHNQLSGPIPLEISTCFPLSSLDLRDNKLSGSIPGQLGLLPLRFFNVSYNRLSGLIPSTLSNTSMGSPRFDVSSFFHNTDLHGYPLLDPTYMQPRRSSGRGGSYKNVVYTVAIVIGAGLTILVVFVCFLVCLAAREQRIELAQKEQRLRQRQAAAGNGDSCSSSTHELEDGWKQVLSQL